MFYNELNFGSQSGQLFGFCLLKHEKVKEKFMMEEKSPFLIATEESATPA